MPGIFITSPVAEDRCSCSRDVYLPTPTAWSGVGGVLGRPKPDSQIDGVKGGRAQNQQEPYPKLQVPLRHLRLVTVASALVGV
jgi:hypothetical protein